MSRPQTLGMNSMLPSRSAVDYGIGGGTMSVLDPVRKMMFFIGNSSGGGGGSAVFRWVDITGRDSYALQ